MDKENQKKPRLLLDIDGVCLPMDECFQSSFEVVDYGVSIKVDEQVVRRVQDLFEIFEVVWTTAWEADCHRFAESLELPTDKPWIEFNSSSLSGIIDYPVETWKLPAVIDYNKQYSGPLAWIDDDLSYDAEDWASQRKTKSPTLLVRTDPGPGISESDFNRLVEFAEQNK